MIYEDKLINGYDEDGRRIRDRLCQSSLVFYIFRCAHNFVFIFPVISFSLNKWVVFYRIFCFLTHIRALFPSMMNSLVAVVIEVSVRRAHLYEDAYSDLSPANGDSLHQLTRLESVLDIFRVAVDLPRNCSVLCVKVAYCSVFNNSASIGNK